tara:strand:+ start:216 stop:437 length:222 start_codon:yes stop_codon:yes gene_type:complete
MKNGKTKRIAKRAVKKAFSSMNAKKNRSSNRKLAKANVLRKKVEARPGGKKALNTAINKTITKNRKRASKKNK